MTAIEDFDRDITLAKPLVWTIASLRADQRAAEIEAAGDSLKLSQVYATVTRLERRIERDVREGRGRPAAPEEYQRAADFLRTARHLFSKFVQGLGNEFLCLARHQFPAPAQDGPGR